MKQSRWSPADLDRQRLVVRRVALRTELDLRKLDTVRRGFVADVRSAVGIPLAIVGCFVVGAAVGRRTSRNAAAAVAQGRRRPTWAVLVTKALKAVVLSAPAYRAFYRSAVPSPHKH